MKVAVDLSCFQTDYHKPCLSPFLGWGDGDPETCPGAWAQWEWGAGGTTLVPHTTQPETSHHGPACQARRFYGAWGSSSFRERTALFLLLF